MGSREGVDLSTSLLHCQSSEHEVPLLPPANCFDYIILIKEGGFPY